MRGWAVRALFHCGCARSHVHSSLPRLKCSVIHISLVPKDYIVVSFTGATVYVLFNILVLSSG